MTKYFPNTNVLLRLFIEHCEIGGTIGDFVKEYPSVTQSMCEEVMHLDIQFKIISSKGNEIDRLQASIDKSNRVEINSSIRTAVSELEALLGTFNRNVQNSKYFDIYEGQIRNYRKCCEKVKKDPRDLCFGQV